MKNTILFLLVLFSYLFQAQNINFADPNFEELLLNNNPGQGQLSGVTALDNNDSEISIDSNNDGEISISEAQLVHDLTIELYPIPNNPINNPLNLEGISNFSNLSKLNIIRNSSNIPHVSLELTEISNVTEFVTYGIIMSDAIMDFSPLTNLESLYMEGNYSLNTITLTNNILLNDLFLRWVSLNSLDLTNNTQLTGLYVSSYNGDSASDNIINLDLSQNPINKFYISTPFLQSLNFKNGVLSEDFSPTFFNRKGIHTSENEFYLCVDDFNLANLDDYQIRKFNPDNDNDTIVANIAINDFCSDTPGGSFSKISGNSKMDINNNGYDTNDISIPYQKLNLFLDADNYIYYSNQEGDYALNIGNNFSNIAINPQFNSSLFTAVSPANYNSALPLTNPVVQNFSFAKGEDYHDVEIYASNGSIIPGNTLNFDLIVTNNGNTMENATFNWQFPSNYMQINSTSETPISTSNGNYLWNLSSLQPFETHTITVNASFNTPTDSNFPLNAGDILNFSSSVAISNTDMNPEDNTFEQNITVVNSYDPNDKTCLNGNRVSNDQIGDYLYYQIRFENLGTANAQTVTVIDSIDTAKFDITTLKPISGSHSFQTEIKNNIAKFTFANINLPFDDSNNDGYVIFKIKTLDTVAPESLVDNRADIYFDYNYPVFTNVEQTIFTDNLGIEDVEHSEIITLSPNPVQNYFSINSEIEITKIEIYDVQGRLIQLLSPNSNNQYNIEGLKNGIYLLKVNGTDNQIQTLKMIKR